jgi:tetratricopeptide (TPR) repeat protein
MAFFESLRTAVGRYAAGVHELGASSDERTLSATEKRLGTPLPPSHRELLRSFDGVSLFHESLRLLEAAQLGVVRHGDGVWLRAGETPDGALYLRPDGGIYLVDEEAPDPILAGSSTEAWLDATLAREGLLVDREGEYRDVFTDDGLSLPVRRKRALLGRRHDPQSALYLLEQAELLAEEGDIETALATLRQAVKADPQAGPAWELFATLAMDSGEREAGEAAARRAAESAWHPPLQAARLTLATRIRTRDSLRVL